MQQQPEPAINAPVPTGHLLQLKVAELRINPGNPRRLFDPEPLADLRDNIRTHGVLVPLTVYRLPGQDLYEILDGQRRFQCCQDLERQGHSLLVPANVVEPPTKIAGLLYMFNIHNYRQPWELMPTALSLRVVMRELDTTDTKRLANLTGLNEKSVERCKVLLTFPEKYQLMSLTSNPKLRIPSNFWIEANPVIRLIEVEVPSLWAELGYEGILDNLVVKYEQGRIRSVIHFRRIVEAFDVVERAKAALIETLDQYIREVDLETRAAFDPFLADSRHSVDAIRACQLFVSNIAGLKLEHISDQRLELIAELKQVRRVVDDLAGALEGSDPPEKPEAEYLEDSEEDADDDAQ